MNHVRLPLFGATLVMLANCGSDAPLDPQPREDASVDAAVDTQSRVSDADHHLDGAADAAARDAGADAAARDAGADSGRDAEVDASADSAADAAKPTPSVRYDYWGIVHTGQSLSVGSKGLPFSTAPQLYGNLKLQDATGEYDGLGDMLSLVPLVSPIKPLPYLGPYPHNIGGETPAEGMSNQLSTLALENEGRALVSVPSVVGQGGRPLSVIEKQAGPQYPAPMPMVETAYWASLYEATQVEKLATQAGKRYGIGGIILTHGESDALLAVASPPKQTEALYAAGLAKLLADYRTDLLAITKQTALPKMFLTQQHITPGGGDKRAGMALGQLLAADQSNGEIVMVGPKYQYEYDADLIHLTAPAYERLGEKYAEVFYRVAVEGRAFAPLAPVSVTRQGAEVRVLFQVDTAPLAFNRTFPVFPIANHPWSLGEGFEVTDSANAKVTILSTTINGNAVVLKLDRDPGSNAEVAYAMTQAADNPGSTSNYAGGLDLGRHGNLHDSDPFVPRDRATLLVSVSGNQVASLSASDAARRTSHDRVTFPGAAGEWIVRAKVGNVFTLDRPAPLGASQAVFESDQRNYAVSFVRKIP
jgi:hypothetical protein